MTPEPAAGERFWIPDNPDGSGWAAVDWVSASQGSRYHYSHTGLARGRAATVAGVLQGGDPPRVTPAPPPSEQLLRRRERLADFLAEISLPGVRK